MTKVPEPDYLPWINIHPLEVSICVPHKNGTTSLGEAMKAFIPGSSSRRWRVTFTTKKLSLSNLPMYPDAYFVVRDPVARFCSLWRNKCRDGETTRALRLKGKTPEQLMTIIESGRNDGHWMRQSDFLAGVNAKPVSIQRLGKLWGEWTGQEFPKFHSTNGELEISDKLRQRILDWYADDNLLWERREND